MIAALLMALTSLLSSSIAEAHQINLTNARVVVGPNRMVDVEIAMKGSDADRVGGTRVFDETTGLVQPMALAATSVPIVGYVEGHTAVLGENGDSCRPGAGSVTPDGDGVVVRILWSCAGVADPLRYRSTVLIDVSPDARQVVLIGTGPDAAQDLLDAGRGETTLTAAPRPTLLRVIERYTGAGIEHIFLGYDHVAFLAAVVLWARRLWPVVKVVTAFTIAHSITLSLAALDIVRIPSTIVEPAIAASIVYVAAENFLSHDIDKRWRDTFGFGLIHGFGFASALQEFGLPRSALVPALASFNLGVEIGQIAIVSLVVPALLGMDRLLANWRGVTARTTRSAVAVYGISAVIIGLGSYWFLARTLLRPDPPPRPFLRLPHRARSPQVQVGLSRIAGLREWRQSRAVGLFSSQCLAGNVKILLGRWNEDLFCVLEGFTDLAHDDEVDARSGALEMRCGRDRFEEKAAAVERRRRSALTASRSAQGP